MAHSVSPATGPQTLTVNAQSGDNRALMKVERPSFIVTIDTEEDFDWNMAFRREGFGLESVSRLPDCQRFFRRYNVIPVYFIDYPIATSAEAIAALAPAAQRGECTIGLQLHPWVNPPHEENVSLYNSFCGNLPRELERSKIYALRDAITDGFGVTPRTFRAGRYGLGKNTIALLAAANIVCDTSVRSGFTYRAGGGPDYHDAPLKPFWWPEGVLELPLTTMFRGLGAKALQPVYHKAVRSSTAMGSILARTGLIERIALTPEGIPVERALKAVDLAVDAGLPVINLSFHSPSLMPGKTPYVQSECDVIQLYRWFDRVINRLVQRNVAPASIDAVVDAAFAEKDGKVAA